MLAGSLPWIVVLLLVVGQLGVLVRDDGARTRELESLHARIAQLESTQAAAAAQRRVQEEDACLSSDEVAFQAMRVANAVSRALNTTLPEIHTMQAQIAHLEQQMRRGGWITQGNGPTVPTRATGVAGGRPATDLNHCRYTEFVDEPVGGEVCPAYGPVTPAVEGFVAAVEMGLPGSYVLRLLGDAQTFLIPAISVLLDQHVQIISEATNSSLRFTGGVSVATAGQLGISGELNELDFGMSVQVDSGGGLSLSTQLRALTISGALVLHDGVHLAIAGASLAALSFAEVDVQQGSSLVLPSQLIDIEISGALQLREGVTLEVNGDTLARVSFAAVNISPGATLAIDGPALDVLCFAAVNVAPGSWLTLPPQLTSLSFSGPLFLRDGTALSVAGGSLASVSFASVVVYAGSSLEIQGSNNMELSFSGLVFVADAAHLAVAGQVVLSDPSLLAYAAYHNDGSVSLGNEVSVTFLQYATFQGGGIMAGERSVSGSLPGTMTTQLSAAGATGSVTLAHDGTVTSTPDGWLDVAISDVTVCGPDQGPQFASGSCVNYVDCPAGQYITAAAAATAAVRAVAVATTGSTCIACAAGQYRAAGGGNSCIACPAGRYRATAGGSSCTHCDVGTSTSCYTRLSGRYCTGTTYATRSEAVAACEASTSCMAIWDSRCDGSGNWETCTTATGTSTTVPTCMYVK